MPEKILVVDDHEDTLDLVAAILKQHGYEVCTARSGKHGLATAATERPDLILLDVMMPELDGYEVCRILRANPIFAKTPIIMFTAKNQVEDKWAGFESGADDYLIKPTDPAELVHRIESLLERVAEATPPVDSGERIVSPDPFRGRVPTPIDTGPSEPPIPITKGLPELTVVLGARGGAGTTTVAINLAAALAQRGLRTTLVDLDLAQGHVAMYLNHKVRSGLNDLVAGADRSITREWQHYVVQDSGGPELLLAQSNLDMSLAVPTESQVVSLIKALVKSDRSVVVDAGRGIQPQLLPALRLAGRIIVCSQPEQVAILAARHLMDTLSHLLAEGSELSLLMVALGREVAMPKDAVEEYLRHPLLATVSISGQEMGQAVSRHTPLVHLLPNSQAAKVFREVADRVAAQVEAHH